MLHAFRSLHVARETFPADRLPESAAAFRRDTITLGWEERLRTRARRRSDGGIEFGTALTRGVVLHAGDCFLLPQLSAVVSVVEAADPVFVVQPATVEAWALFAYHIGNSHQPMMVDGDAIVCPDVAGMEQVLTYHRIPFVRSSRPFSPVGLASPGEPGGPEGTGGATSGALIPSHRHRPGRSASER